MTKKKKKLIYENEIQWPAILQKSKLNKHMRKRTLKREKKKNVKVKKSRNTSAKVDSDGQDISVERFLLPGLIAEETRICYSAKPPKVDSVVSREGK